MKHAFIFTALILFGSMSSGKVNPAFTPSATDSLDNNRSFIHTHTMLNAQGDSIRHEIQYFDGLGKPIQTVKSHFSPVGGDLINTTTYDSMGRVSRQWLPLHVQGNNGAFLPTAVDSTLKQYADSLPCERLTYDHLPESRVVMQAEAGEAWRGKVVQTEYLVNDETGISSCLYYLIDDNGNLSLEGSYQPETLLVKKETDEDGKSVYTFSDAKDKTILIRTINGSVWHDTYYVYDRAKENLCYVLSPMYQEHPDLDLYAYQYRYDEYDRCVLKKLPGVGAIRYVYDKADHLVCYQDGNQTSRKEWTFTVQDKMGRNAMIGIADTSTDNLPQLQDKIVLATRTQGAGDVNSGYAISNLVGMSGVRPKEVSYYDDYNFISLENATVQQQLTYGFADFPSLPDSVKSSFSTGYMTVSGLQSGMRTYTDKDEHLTTSFYYDKKGNMVQQRSMNHLGGYDVDFYSYTFTGLTNKHIHLHSIPGKDAVTEYYSYTYDNGDRLKQVSYRLNNEKEIVLSENEYDNLCQLRSTRLNSGKIVLNYDYNLRGWITSINSTNFSQKLHYTDGTGTPYYNGNISSMTWHAGIDATERGYRFAYDDMNRLTDAIYGEGGSLANHSNRFNEQVTGYDKQNNILGLKRTGQTSATDYGLIDNLSLTYNGNQLQKVTDNAVSRAYNNGFEFVDGPKQESTEYTYDANGNLTKDLNKKIAEISYNWLNLPQKITFEDGSTIVYTYDANGAKLRTVHNIAGTTTTTDYCGNAIYENGELKTLFVESGYISFADKKLHFYLKDHQGNVRVVADEEGKVEEANNYYPFGGIFASTSSIQPYKYNGKELDSRKGLNWYDYGARMYDPALGRWHAADPMAEKYYSDSPYNYCGNEPIGRIDPNGTQWTQDRFGFFLWDKNAEDQKSTRQGWTYIGPTLPEETSSYRILEEINGGLYHKNTINPLASLVNWVAGEDIMVEKKAYDPAEEHMMQEVEGMGMGTMIGGTALIGGKVVGKVVEKAAGKVASKLLSSTLKPLGKGVTGRNIPNNLSEQLAMKEIQSNPNLGKVVMQNMSDIRWKGWDKYQFTHTLENGKKIIVHYVGKSKNGKLIAVDDFKFK